MTVDAYGWWQGRLADEYFGPGHDGTPTLFFVDDDEERRLREGGVDDLATVVSGVLNWQSRTYYPVVRKVDAWRSTDRSEAPPCLPLLAATVLAASRMRRGDGVPAHAFYARLAEVLSPPPYRKVRDHRERLKRDYEDVVGLWEDLHNWLEQQGGRRGISTIRTWGSRRLIGWPQSQALLRASDRAVLTKFFKANDVVPGSGSDGSALVADLKIWCANKPGLSRRLREAVESTDDDEFLAPLLSSLADAWDGAVVLPMIQGRAQLALQVALEDDLIDGWTLTWIVPRVRGVDEDVLVHTGGSFAVSAAEGRSSYELSGDLPDAGAALAYGFEARGQHAAVRVADGRHVIALLEDPVAGAWVETDVLRAHGAYTFLVDTVGQSLLRRLFQQLGERWYYPEETGTGWFVVPEVTFTDESQLRAAMDAVGLAGVSHGLRRRPVFTGGLRYRQDLGRSHYLLGGEPDLVLPDGATGTEWLLDGESLQAPPGEKVRLRGRGLCAGEHVVAGPGTRTAFWLHALPEFQRAEAASSVPLWASSAQEVLVPFDGDSRFLLANGRFIWIPAVDCPSWWNERAPGLATGGCFTAVVPEEAVWLATFSSDGSAAVVLVRRQAPAIGHLSPRAKEFWISLINARCTDVSDARLWKKYKEEAMKHAMETGRGRV